MTIFHNAIKIPGHDVTFRLLTEILQDYHKACFATGKWVEQPHLKEAAIKAIQELSPFYSEADANKLLDRAVARRSRPGKRP